MRKIITLILLAFLTTTQAQEIKLTYKVVYDAGLLHPDSLLSVTKKSPKFDTLPLNNMMQTRYLNIVYNDTIGYSYYSFKNERRYHKKKDSLYGSKPVHHDIYFDLINLKKYDYSDFKMRPTLFSFNMENSPLVFTPINSIDSLKYRTGYFINDRNLMVYFVLRKQEEAGFLYRKFPGVVLSYYIPNYNYYLQLMKEETGHFSITKPDLPIVYPKK
ncbi:MAG: hypothetical protein ABS68_04535 [Niastella sp. SCN 39-18]|nr:hypothetical protein [Sphingobacteriales bacterium]ODT53894.1 MAG: hypothetical protein ABS68_04535 [Niastella sp. SCN 39-18]OJW07542.1 MAG: hypothetical protein BGO53_03280 [Sphingobacteriales bacterium 39-19]